MLERLKYRLRNAYCKHARLPLIILLCAVTAITGVMLSRSLRTISISDGKNRYLVRSLSSDVPSALKVAGIRTNGYRIVTLNKSGLTTNVEIEYTFPVYITSGDKTTEVIAIRATVEEILTAAGFSVDKFDIIEPAADKVISETVYIDYTDIEYIDGSYEETIPAGVETIYDSSKPVGYQAVTTGSNGVQKVNYTEKYVNGVSVEKTIGEKVVITAAVNTQKTVGTKPTTSQAVMTSNEVKSISTLTPSSPIELDANGRPVHYIGKKTVQATAYTYTGNNCATGVAPQPGYIAVNPKLIPYGTRMYIVSSDGKYTYGYAVAADTGGFINSRPSNVDLFFSTKSACSAFGRRNVEIYFLP